MGSVPSELDKNKDVTNSEMKEELTHASKKTGPSLSSPPRIEEMEEDLEENSSPKTQKPSLPEVPPEINEEHHRDNDNTIKITGTLSLSSSSSKIEEMEEDSEDDHPTSKETVSLQMTLSPTSSPPPRKNPEDEELEHSITDLVNVTDLPMEGPQEIEHEDEYKEKEMEPQNHENHQEDKPSSSSSPPTPIYEDHDHTYSSISSPSATAATQVCSVVMETTEEINISLPEPLPESSIETICSPPSPLPAASPSPPPLKEVEDQQLTHLQNELTRLEAELILERTSKQELSSQLLQSQTQFTQLTSQLNEAASIIIEQQKAVSTLAEKESLIESLQSDLLKERTEKSLLSQKYEKQQRSLVNLTKEFNEIFVELQTHFATCCKPNQQNQMDPSNMSWMSNQQLQNKLDQLTTSVQERYQFWTAQQRKMEEELGDTRKTMEELIELLEGMEEVTPKEKSTSSSPPPQKLEPPESLSSPPANQPEEIKHGKDLSKKLFCLCGQQFFSESTLRNHIKRSTGELKYKCEECSMGFVYPSDLAIHFKSRHKNTLKSPRNKATPPPPKNKRVIWSCDFCDNSFFKADIYQSHIKTCRTTAAGSSSTADISPPPLIKVDSSSPPSISNSPPPASADDSSDDDITIIEDDSTFTSTPSQPSFSIPLRGCGPSPFPSKSTSIIPPVMSRVAQLYMSSSPISFLPTPPPPPLPPGIVKVVQHPPIPNSSPSTSGTPSSYTSKKHSRDITKRHIGFFCICGIKFISRKRLDGHLTFRNGRINGSFTSRSSWKPLTLEQIKKEKMSQSQPSGNFQNLKTISRKRSSGGRSKSKKKHGVSSIDPLQCLCGRNHKSPSYLQRHIRYHTATKTIPCEYCDKLFLSNSFLNHHYKVSHQVEMMTQSLATATGKSSKKSKPGKLKNKTKARVAASTATSTTTAPPTIPVQVHRLDYFKSDRGNFCKCGRKFSSKRKLNIHLYRKNSDVDGIGGDGGGGEDDDGVGVSGNWKSPSRKKQGVTATATTVVGAAGMTGTAAGFSKFTCMTCGENFTSNVDRIRHRVQAHGHGLF